MNLDELRSVQSKERQKDSLQNLRPSFYQEVGEYIAELEDERERVAEAADDPFSSPEVSQLTDEIETAKDVVEAIYERRMGKLVKQASLSAAGMAADEDGLTAEEADLFDDLVDRIQSNKSRVLDVLEGLDVEGEPGPDAAERIATSTSNAEPQRERSSPAAVDETGARNREQSARESPTSETGEETPPDPPEPETPPPEIEPGSKAATDSEPKADSTPGPTAESPSRDDSISAADVMGGDVEDSPSTEPSDTGASSVDPSGANPVGNGPETEQPEDSQPSAGDSVADEPTGTGSADRPNTGTSDSSNRTADTDSPNRADETVEASDSSVDRLTVKITQDVGSILGVDDREYELAAEDVVTLPEQNAKPLVEREAAEQLE